MNQFLEEIFSQPKALEDTFNSLINEAPIKSPETSPVMIINFLFGTVKSVSSL